MGIGNAGCLFDLLTGSVFDTEGDIVEHRVVEENGLLVDIAYQTAQRLDAQRLDVFAVDEDFAVGNIVIAGNEVDKRRFART